ncbi:hypothetical protein VNO77_28840 [Canavalia gladiata]|uniref:Uncharacterized protein n=1 Tax=Canavalia gladiata TaxID=3824 RepID=A0AAN9Q7E0_CANGL
MKNNNNNKNVLHLGFLVKYLSLAFSTLHILLLVPQLCLSGWVDPKIRDTGSITGVMYDYVKPFLGKLSLFGSNLVLFIKYIIISVSSFYITNSPNTIFGIYFHSIFQYERANISSRKTADNVDYYHTRSKHGNRGGKKERDSSDK